MQRAAFGVCEVVTLVVGNEVDNGTLGECGRLVENKPPLLDTRSERAHVSTVSVSSMPGKRSRRSTERLDVAKPGGYLVPTRVNWGRHSKQLNHSREQSITHDRPFKGVSASDPRRSRRARRFDDRRIWLVDPPLDVRPFAARVAHVDVVVEYPSSKQSTGAAAGSDGAEPISRILTRCRAARAERASGDGRVEG